MDRGPPEDFAVKKAILLGVSVGGLCALVVAACGGSSEDNGFGSPDGAAGDGRAGDDGSVTDATLISDAPRVLGDGASGCPSTCPQLGADCGATTDTRCGGVVQCGTCAA